MLARKLLLLSKGREGRGGFMLLYVIPAAVPCLNPLEKEREGKPFALF